MGLSSSAVVALANREALYGFPDRSVNDYWFAGGRLNALFLFLLPVLGALMSLALAARPPRVPAATALAVLGLAGLANFTGPAAWTLTTAAEVGLGRGTLLGLLGSILMLAAGVAAGFGAASEPPEPVVPLIPPISGGVSVLVLVSPLPYLVREYEVFWYFLPLTVLLVAAVVVSRSLRRLGPGAGGSALAAIGVSLALTYADLLDGGIYPGEDSDLTTIAIVAVFVAALVQIVAGLAVLARGGAPTADLLGADPDPLDAELPDTEPLATTRPDGERSEATRHLCVAMHLDGDLARRAMREVIDGDARAIAPSLGVDLGMVVRHCLIARHRQRVRDAVLLCLSALALVSVYALVVEQQAAAFRYLLLIVVAGWAVVAVERIVARHGVVARRLTRAEFARQPRPLLDAAEERKVRALERLEVGNVTPYGGFFPFVGSGKEVGGWSFALSVLRGSETIAGDRAVPRPFDVDDLYDAVRADIDRLGIEGLSVEDRLYVDGEDLAADRRFLAIGPPPQLRTEISAEQLREFVRKPELANRVYRCIRVYGWGGEFVLSIYLNFTQAGQGLFTEARYFLLLPPKPEHVALDHGVEPLSVGAAIRTATSTIRLMPRVLGSAGRGATADLRELSRPPVVVTAGTDAFTTANLGATTSLRELAQGTNYRRYFQRLDSEMTTKIVERQLLDSIARFLREHQVDTSELQERQTAILNYGLIVSGGTMTAQSVAVGQNAQSLISRLSAAIRPPKDEGTT
jgi:hypothetical protein